MGVLRVGFLPSNYGPLILGISLIAADPWIYMKNDK